MGERLNVASALLGRALLSLIFIISGFHKLAAYGATAAYMDKFGVPGLLLPLVIGVEIGGGALILAGFHTRAVAFVMAGFTFLAGALFHLAAGDPGNMIHFWKNVAIAGGFLGLSAAGGGAWSADSLIHHRRRAAGAAG